MTFPVFTRTIPFFLFAFTGVLNGQVPPSSEIQLGDNFSITPALHLNTVVGSSSADHPEEFAAGAHDPNRDGAVQLQSLEPSLSLRWGEHLAAFATGSLFTDIEDDFEWEWEEIFVKLHNLPAGMELRGGRFLNRVGFQNPVHLHGWETVDAPLPHALFLGDEGLQTLGGELNFHLDTRWPSVLSISFGSAPEHDHHGHGHDDHGHDDHGHDAHGHDDHGHDDHGDHGALEELRLEDDFVTLGFRKQFRQNDFHALNTALAGGRGDNEEGGNTWFALAGLEYHWRENGFEPGGREVIWRTEVIRFSGDANGRHHDDDHHDDDHADHHDDHDEDGHMRAQGWGYSTLLAYQATDRLRPFARLDRVDGLSGLDLPSWTRYSVGTRFNFTQNPATYLRLQGNFDERGSESEQSVWVQLGFSFGGPEVR